MKRVLFLNGIDRKINCGYYTQTFFVGDLSSKFSTSVSIGVDATKPDQENTKPTDAARDQNDNKKITIKRK